MKRVIQSSHVTLRQLEWVVGLLNLAGPMLQLGKPFSNSNSLDEHLLFGENRDESIQVTASLGEALLPFIDCKLDKPISFHSHSPSLDNLMDASNSG